MKYTDYIAKAPGIVKFSNDFTYKYDEDLMSRALTGEYVSVSETLVNECVSELIKECKKPDSTDESASLLLVNYLTKIAMYNAVWDGVGAFGYCLRDMMIEKILAKYSATPKHIAPLKLNIAAVECMFDKRRDEFAAHMEARYYRIHAKK